MTHAFTRVTLIGPRTHIDLLLPSDQPVGLLLPQVLTLLGDQPAEQAAAKVLVTADGTELHSERSLEQARVLDGSALLLCNAAEAPPAAVVYDVTDVVVSATSATAGSWSRGFSILASGSFTAAGIWAGAEILLTPLAPDPAVWVLPVLSLLGLAAGTAAGHPPRRTAAGPTLLGAGWLTGVGGALHLYGGIPAQLPAAALMLSGISILALAALGIISARPRPFFSGAMTLALGTAVWTAAGAAAGNTVEAAALAALAGTVLLGLLPKLALAVSGLATLDDRRATGGAIVRIDALEAVAAAHQGLTLGTVLTALCLTPALWLLGADTGRQTWSFPLLLTLILAVFLRARSFPLAAQRLALYLAVWTGLGGAVLAGLRLFTGQPWAVGIAVLVLAAAASVSLTVPLPGHTMARFRLLATRVETAAVLASVPLVTGLFGLFDTLAGSFS